MAPSKKKEFLTLTQKIAAKLKKGMPDNDDGAYYELAIAHEQVLSTIKYVIKIGNQPFDDEAGGMPFGRVVELFGLDSCGKSAMVIRTACRAIGGHIYRRVRVGNSYTEEKLDPSEYELSILYLDNESSLDDPSKMTVDGVTLSTDNANIGRCNTVELMFKEVDLAVQVLKEETDHENKAAEEEGRTSKLYFLLVVIDTIAATSSKEELGREWGKDDYSRQAKQLREGFRKMIQDISRYNVCMICTNQVSDNIKDAGERSKRKWQGPMYEDFVAFGGKALRYYATFRIFVHALKTKYTLVRGSQFPDGLCIGFITVKNRMRKPLREGRMVLLFDEVNGGLNNTMSILESLLFLGLAEYGDDGEFIFKCKSNGVLLTTFPDIPQESLEDQDRGARKGRRGGYKDPRIYERYEWPKFYQEHKTDMDALWKKAVDYAFSTTGEGCGAVQRESEVVTALEMIELKETDQQQQQPQPT